MRKLNVLLAMGIAVTVVLTGCNSAGQGQNMSAASESEKASDFTEEAKTNVEEVLTVAASEDENAEKELFAKSDNVMEADDENATKAIAAGDISQQEYKDFCNDYNRMVNYYNECCEYYCKNDSIPADKDIEYCLSMAKQSINLIATSASNGIRREDLQTYYDCIYEVCGALEELIELIS